MADVMLMLSSMAVIVYSLLYLQTESLNPITQVRRLMRSVGVARGVVTVTALVVLLVGLTALARADTLRAGFTVGLDYPLGGRSPQCEEGYQIASNLTARAGAATPWAEVGLALNHQSCAIAEDDVVTDAWGLYVLKDFGPLEVTVDAQRDKHNRSQERYAVMGEWVLYELQSYKLGVFVQGQTGWLHETSAGVNLHWSF